MEAEVTSQKHAVSSGPQSANYAPGFFTAELGGAFRSAQKVAPVVMDRFSPKSVIDVGCGNGGWAKAFQALGCERILGIDGDYVPRESLLIDPKDFRASDLESPIAISERFDLAICMEVAEHLTEKRGKALVLELTLLAPVVLFSAAVPGQQGTHHINEQPQSYWVNMFKQRGYVALDILRSKFWHDSAIESWYRQNMMIFAHPEKTGSSEELGPLVDICHPDLLRAKAMFIEQPPLSYMLREIGPSFARAVKKRIGL